MWGCGGREGVGIGLGWVEGEKDGVEERDEQKGRGSDGRERKQRNM